MFGDTLAFENVQKMRVPLFHSRAETPLRQAVNFQITVVVRDEEDGFNLGFFKAVWDTEWDNLFPPSLFAKKRIAACAEVRAFRAHCITGCGA